MEEIDFKNNIFDSIKHIDEMGNEYWFARELQPILEYKQWRRFEKVIKNAMIACKVSNYNVFDHFANVGKMIEIAKNGGTMPEDLPKPNKSLKELEKEKSELLMK